MTEYHTIKQVSKCYFLSLRRAAENAVAASMDGRPPETQKAVSGLIHLMITSWNDAEAWAANTLRSMPLNAVEVPHEPE